MKNNLGVISILTLVTISFALGYSFAYRQYIILFEQSSTDTQYVDISTSTRNITIKKAPENILFRVNGELMSTGSIDLK